MSSTTPAHSEKPIETPGTRTVDMKLEVVVIPVSDVDRAKRFYGGLGWRLDADFVVGDTFRACSSRLRARRARSISAPESRRPRPARHSGLFLVVSDIEAARAELVGRGVEVSEVFHRAGPGKPPVSGRHPERRSYCSFATFRDPDGNGWLLQEVTARLPGRVDADDTTSPPSPISRPRCGARRPPTASTRSGPAASATRTGRTGTPSTWWRSRPASRCPFEQRARLCAHVPANRRGSSSTRLADAYARLRRDRSRPSPLLGTAAMALAALSSA